MDSFAIAASLLFAALQPVPELPPASRAAGPLRPVEPSPPPAPAASAAKSDPRAGVDALLGTRDGAVSPARWRKLGPGAGPILEEIALDEGALSTRRARAIEGLSTLRTERSPALLTRLAQAGDESFLVRLAAMRGAARTLPPARQLAALRPALEKATDVRLRAAAADLLSHSRANCAAVREQSQREPAEMQPRFEASLRRCGSK